MAALPSVHALPFVPREITRNVEREENLQCNAGVKETRRNVGGGEGGNVNEYKPPSCSLLTQEDFLVN